MYNSMHWLFKTKILESRNKQILFESSLSPVKQNKKFSYYFLFSVMMAQKIEKREVF